MEQMQIASFVIRFHLVEVEADTGKKIWRIKITHVQEDRDTLFESIEEAMAFMKNIVEES